MFYFLYCSYFVGFNRFFTSGLDLKPINDFSYCIETSKGTTLSIQLGSTLRIYTQSRLYKLELPFVRKFYHRNDFFSSDHHDYSGNI